MLRCNEVTRLWASETLSRSSLRKRAGVRIHLAMCRSCRRYVRELRAIGNAARDMRRGEHREDRRIEALVRKVFPDSPPRER